MPKGIYKRKPSEKRKKHLEKLEVFHIGRKRSQTTIENIKSSVGGEKHHYFGKKRPEHSILMSGENHPNWKGGISENPYPKEFNTELKLKIRTRDNFICCLCEKTEREEYEELNRALCVNHIDFNKQNCKEENLNTLCLRCNIKINRERDYWTNYFSTL